MDKTEARIRLSFHSGRNSLIDDPRWANGFLGSLRPFRGELRQENFHVHMHISAVKSLALRVKPSIINTKSQEIHTVFFLFCL